MPLDFPIVDAGPLSSAVRAKGTCSSKHRLLAALAHECGRTDVALAVGLYRMSEDNTPGVGAVLEAAGLSCIPEMHCYLRHDGRRYDYTGLAAGERSPFDSLVDERTVSPDELVSVKLALHREAIDRWARALRLESGKAWAIREQCVRALSERGHGLRRFSSRRSASSALD